MVTSRLLGLVLWLLIGLCHADLLTDAAAEMPPCGIQCILESVPGSACTLTNATCLCTDSALYLKVLECVSTSCMPLDAIKTAKVEADACNRPTRSRKADLFAALAIEIPAFFLGVLRIISRLWTATQFAADDYVMVVVMVLYAIFEVVGQYSGAIAFGVDIWTVDTDTLTQALKLFYIAEAFYLGVLTLTKIVILCFYLRIFPNKTFRYLTYATMVWVGVSGTIFIFMEIFQCVPIAFVWEGWKGTFGSAKCLNVNTLGFTAAGISIAQDVVILLLPLPLLARLNMNWRKKAGIMLMFSLGIFILITSCIRLRSLVLFAKSVNPTWDYSDALIWTGLECAVSIIVVSLPAIRVLLSRIAPSIFGSTTRGGDYTEGSRGLGTGGESRLRQNHSKKGVELSSVSSQRGFGTEAKDKFRHSRSKASRASVHRVFGLASSASRTAVDPNESELELGDKIKGDVHTTIGVGDHRDSAGVNGPSDRQQQQSHPSNTPAGWEEGSSIGSIESVPEALPSPTESGIRVHTIMTRSIASGEVKDVRQP